MGYTDIVGLENPCDSLRSAFDVGYNSCSISCWVPVSFCGILSLNCCFIYYCVLCLFTL